MAFTGEDQCWVPDAPVTEHVEWRLDIAQFGDGYAQRMLDGINALQREWDVVFANRPQNVIVQMQAYIMAQKGNSFQFKDPTTGAMYDVWCDEWQIDWPIRRRGASPATPIWYGTLSATFVKAYGITG